MNIISIFILRRPGHPDIVSLHTDLPDAMCPHEGTLDLSFRCARDSARAYCATYWPDAPIEVVGA